MRSRQRRYGKRKLLILLSLFGFALPASAADPRLAATPPMGWDSWNHFACKVTAADVRSAADAIAGNGLKDAGYVYVNIDDGWEGTPDEAGRIQPNAKFGDGPQSMDSHRPRIIRRNLFGTGPFWF